MDVEVTHYLTTSDESYAVAFTEHQLKHCTYVDGLIKLEPLQSVRMTLGCHLDAKDGISYPIDRQQLDCLAALLRLREDDEHPMTQEDIEKFCELGPAETDILKDLTGLRVFGLAQAAEFIGHKAIMGIVARKCAQILENKNESEVLEVLGLEPREFTNEELELARKIVPEAFE